MAYVPRSTCIIPRCSPADRVDGQHTEGLLDLHPDVLSAQQQERDDARHKRSGLRAKSHVCCSNWLIRCVGLTQLTILASALQRCTVLHIRGGASLACNVPVNTVCGTAVHSVFKSYRHAVIHPGA